MSEYKHPDIEALGLTRQTCFQSQALETIKCIGFHIMFKLSHKLKLSINPDFWLVSSYLLACHVYIACGLPITFVPVWAALSSLLK